MMANMNDCGTTLLEIEDLKKSFRGVQALSNGRLSVRAGAVHALCGGNGAGKSTMLKIVMGHQPKDSGVIKLKGQEVSFSSAAEALDSGIALISQELSPIMDMTVAENMFLGRESTKAGVFVDRKGAVDRARGILRDLQFDVDPAARMSQISLAQMQLVEIAKALSYDADVVIMDEPTSAIGEHEVHILFEAIRRIRSRGKAIIYVSHKLTEIFEIADDYTVMRDGEFIETGKVADINRAHLVRQIVGREVVIPQKHRARSDDEVMLSVCDLSKEGEFNEISLEVAKGEVVGIYGLLGSGRTEFLEAVYGMRVPDSGEVRLEGRVVPFGNPKRAIQLGISMVPEDRKLTGLVLSSSIADNIVWSVLRRLNFCGFVNKKRENTVIKEMVAKNRIKAASSSLEVECLSGGNQQKVVFARCMTTNPRLIICDEPTRGIDEGSKQEIYAFLRKFAADGNAVLVVSSEAPEILQVSDRIAIFKRGKISAFVNADDATQQVLMELAS